MTPDDDDYELTTSGECYKNGASSLKWVWPDRAEGVTDVKLDLNLGAQERNAESERIAE